MTLNIKNLDEIFLHKHCKEGPYVITHFWPHTKNQEKKNLKYKRIYIKKA